MISFFTSGFLVLGLVVHATHDNWGVPTSFGRQGSPAVVNAPVRAPEQDVFSLNGEWEILTDEKSIPYGAKPWALDSKGGLPTRLKDDEAWRKFLKVGAYHRDGTGVTSRVTIPGFWEVQGIGEKGVGRYWDSPDRGAFVFRHVFSGSALLRRRFTAPSRWKGRRLWFKVGGVQNQAYFWFNARPAAFIRQSCGTYKFDITDLIRPGEAFDVVALVHTDGPSKFGSWNSLHHLSGFYRALEIEATDEVWLDDVWCRGSAAASEAEIHVSLGGLRKGEDCVVRAVVGDAEAVTKLATGEDAVLRLPVPGGRLWSPEQPNLHTARVTVVRGGKIVGAWHERFGVRTLEVRDKQFYLNGRPFFVRGCGNHGRDALTYINEAKASLLRHRVSLLRAAGFNQSRHHTNCPFAEYFDAADELGVFVQPELPYACSGPNEAIPFSPLFDAAEYVRHCRRHPSFGMLSMGNEGHLAECDGELYRWMKANAPNVLVVHNDGGYNAPGNTDFYTGPDNVWTGSLTNRPRPFVAHEYLNLGIKEDPRDADRYTGLVSPPRSWRDFDAGLVRAGLTREWGLRCVDAAQRLQAFYEKRGIEAARMDPACSGYSFWSITDSGASTTGPSVAQGYFNAFWEPKRCGLKPDEFARFNGADAILIRPRDSSRVLVSGESFAADILLAAYGERDLAGTEVTWCLASSSGELQRGSLPVIGSVAPGPARTIAALNCAVPAVVSATKVMLEISFGGVSNSWEYWIFPPRARRDGRDLAVEASLINVFDKLYRDVAVIGSSAAAGRKVEVRKFTEGARPTPGARTLFVAQTDGKPNVSLGWWWLGDQVGTAFAGHPALKGLPHDGYLSPLFFRILKRGKPLPFASVPVEKLIAVGEGRDGYFCYLGGDRETLYAFGLDVLNGTVEASSLLDGLIDYLRGL